MWPTENVGVLVASSNGVNRDLLNKWLRRRKEIFEATALQPKRRRGFQLYAQKIRRKKGRFAEAEEEVYRLFTAAREKGFRVGPRWLCQCARREVRRKYQGTPLEEAGNKFDATTMLRMPGYNAFALGSEFRLCAKLAQNKLQKSARHVTTRETKALLRLVPPAPSVIH